MARLQPLFPKNHGKPRLNDRRVLSGIIFINRNGLRWCDAPKEHGPAKTFYNRWKRSGGMGVFARMMEGPASEAAVPTTVTIDATCLKAHRTASSLRSKKGGLPPACASIPRILRDHVETARDFTARVPARRPLPQNLLLLSVPFQSVQEATKMQCRPLPALPLVARV